MKQNKFSTLLPINVALSPCCSLPPLSFLVVVVVPVVETVVVVDSELPPGQS